MNRENIDFTLLKATFIFIICIFIISCEVPNQPVSNTNTNAGAPTANANAASSQPAAKNAVRMPVTLPVLDAMFYDESFTGELKTAVGLTDEEIDKLKKASSDAVANLGEADENSGSTRAAARRAEEQIRAIVGEEKANKLFEMVSRRWASGEIDGETALPAKPNSIPTDTRIVVNAPAYRMDVFQDGKLIKTYKIGIGYPEFPLPNGIRKADTIIFNPTWTPPDEPWVKGKVRPGKTVEAGSSLNPLGPIKIPIGLPSLIHGGKNPARLGTFASHGCVGLTSPQVQDFSLMLAQISGTELSTEDVSNYEKQKTETKNVKLSKTVPVELRYETIVVENGKLKIFRDVYEHGTNTEENLRKVLEVYGVSFDNIQPADRQKILDALNKMNRDAAGQPISEPAADNTNAANKTNSNNAKNEQSDKVTRTIKGEKEIEIVLAELSGKGYPQPVNLSSGAK